MQQHPNNKNQPELDRLLAAEAKPKHEPAPGMNNPNTGTQPSLADQSKPADSSANKALVPTQRTRRDAELAAALRMMIASLRQGQRRRFMVGLPKSSPKESKARLCSIESKNSVFVPT
jgi:hypothetical protein